MSRTTSKFIGNNQFSGKSTLELFKEKYVIDSETDCWNWIGGHNLKGYGQFGFRNTSYQAHRVSWILNVGEIPDGMFVLHHCDNPGCVNPDHLFLGTNMDNMRDMANKGRSTRGTRSHTCKINEQIVREIRSSKKTARQLSNEYGISFHTVRQVKYRRIWKWVE